VRRVAVVFLLVVGIVLTPFAIIGLWTQVVLLDTDRFVDLGDELLDRGDVRDALGTKIAEQVVEVEPAAAPAESTIAAGVAGVADTELFRARFADAMGQLHQQLEDGDDTLVLDLTPTLDAARSLLQDIDPAAAAAIPADVGDITITSRDDQPVLWAVVTVADGLSIGAIVGVIVAFGLAVALAESRWRLLGVAGVIVVMWSLLLVIGLPLIRNSVTNGISDDVIRSGARGAWVVVTRSLQVEALLAALVGVIAAGVGFVLDLAGSRRQAAAVP
jgi:hypothetical protein